MVTFTTILERSDNKLWGAHFAVPKEKARSLVRGSSRRVVCRINGSEERQCALIPHKGGSFVITVNKSLRESEGWRYGTKLHVSLRPDQSKYGLPMAAELQELFRQDNEFNASFHALTPGRQRTLLYIVNSAKHMDERVFRTVTIARHLKENSGRIDYRKLNLMLRKESGRTPRMKKGLL